MYYFEQLQTPEWKNKRAEILLRDNYECQRCAFKVGTIPVGIAYPYETLKNSYKAIFTLPFTTDNHVSFIDIFIKGETFKSKIIQDESPQCYSDKLGDYYLIIYGDSIKNSIENLYDVRGFQEIPIKRWNSKISDSLSQLITEDMNALYENSSFEPDFELAYSVPGVKVREIAKTQLHIHHKCYRTGHEAWEQPNSDYISLCNVCHKFIHESTLIPYYQGNNIIQLMKPCLRCNGQRYFECYRHIENGKCFRCNGTGFETN